MNFQVSVENGVGCCIDESCLLDLQLAYTLERSSIREFKDLLDAELGEFTLNQPTIERILQRLSILCSEEGTRRVMKAVNDEIETTIVLGERNDKRKCFSVFRIEPGRIECQWVEFQIKGD